MEEREDRLLTVAEVAEYFRVEPESVRRWLREGKILGINLGRGPGWRIRLGDLEAFITERHTSSGEPPPDLDENGDTVDGGAVAIAAERRNGVVGPKSPNVKRSR